MASTDEIKFDSHIIRIYNNGRVERLFPSDYISPAIDPNTNVSSKDEKINRETNLSVRVYLPEISENGPKKLPIVIYYHGGAFCIGSAFSSHLHNYLNRLVPQLNCVLVSVDYRLAPEHPIPIAYDDSWEALKWVISYKETESDDWLSMHGDFKHIYLAGDSAGGNIVHHMAMKAGNKEFGDDVDIEGLIMVHPYFIEDIDGSSMKSMWKMTCPYVTGLEDYWINPMMDGAPSLSGLKCNRVLICMAEMDFLGGVGRSYYEKLVESGWKGEVEIFETKGEGHCFHFFDADSDKAMQLTRKISDFINNGM